MLDGLYYASFVQQGFMPQERHFKKNNNDYFVYYDPLQIIGGDFFWLGKKDGWSYYAVGDCTGHGVGGAMLSTLAIGFLNYLVYSKDYSELGDILSEIDKKWIETFKRHEDDNELNGLIKVERDIEQIKKAIKKVSNPIKYLRYSKQAKNTALELSWKNRTLELLKKYNYSMKDQLIQGYKNTKILAIQSKEPVPEFTINFINGPFFETRGGKELEYEVSFIDKKNNEIVHQQKILSNHWVRADKKHFVDWKIIAKDGIHEYEYNLDLTNQRVYIALDSKSLGDTLAWFPYIEEFQKISAFGEL